MGYHYKRSKFDKWGTLKIFLMAPIFLSIGWMPAIIGFYIQGSQIHWFFGIINVAWIIFIMWMLSKSNFNKK